VKHLGLVRVLLGAITLVGATAASARADQKFELGTSLASALIGVGNNQLSTFGLPTGAGIGAGSPGVYGSIFVGDRIAVEPQLAFIVVSAEGNTTSFLTVSGQVDYFVRGISKRSPYVFAAVGVSDVSGDTPTKSISGGVGYRIPVGDRLTFRVDGRFMHFIDNAIVFGVSIGGLFGRR